jgi:fermentation-respiration switch protein FrsA (DUF1100 family)
MSLGERMFAWLIYHPDTEFTFTPDAVGIDGEEVRITAEDGTRLQAYWLPYDGADRALLFLHGNAGNASYRIQNGDVLRTMGIDVLLLEYRGYGRSGGEISEEGLYEDARAGLAYLVEDRGIPERRIVVFGRSLGGAVAVDVAQDRDLAGVILESTFSSAWDAADALFDLPVGWIAWGLFESDRKIGRVRAPLLFIHGDRDEVIHYPVGMRLFEAAPEPKELFTVRGGRHADTMSVGGGEYLRRVAAFIDRVAPRNQSQPITR